MHDAHLLVPHRYNYVTPTSYLELLTTFIKLLGDKRDEVVASKKRLEVGLDKLTSTAAQVSSHSCRAKVRICMADNVHQSASLSDCQIAA